MARRKLPFEQHDLKTLVENIKGCGVFDDMRDAADTLRDVYPPAGSKLFSYSDIRELTSAARVMNDLIAMVVHRQAMVERDTEFTESIKPGDAS